jgi:hypothetical protein
LWWTPKGLNVRTVDKPVLGNITWSQTYLFFEMFCEHALLNKLHGRSNFIFFRPTDQKLWVFENFRRSLGRAGMCWSQWERVDYMCKILGARGRKEGTRRVQEGRKMMRIVGRSAIAWLAGFWLAAVARQVLVARNGLRPAVACRPRGVVCTNYACPPNLQCVGI